MVESIQETTGPAPAELGGDALGGAGALVVLMRGRSDSVRWWKPSLATLLGELGWAWWLLLGLCTLVLAGWVAILPFAGIWGLVTYKIALLGVVVILTIRSKAVRRILAARREPFCIHCGYSLDGLDAFGDCPECGMPYSLAVVEDYRRDPAWFIRRYEMARAADRAGLHAAVSVPADSARPSTDAPATP